MKILYHFALCPFSRQIRVLLNEKGIEYDMITENYWERSNNLAKLNPAFELPVLIENNECISDVFAIFEYIEEKYGEAQSFLGKNIKENYEIRRIASWFNRKFYNEVTKYVINEKIIRFYNAQGTPDSEMLKAARYNFTFHMEYIKYLINKRSWLATNRISFADIVAGSHLSILDYLGEIFWENYPEVKEWYAVIKSRPSFRSIINDRIPGFSPSSNYTNLDF